MKRISIIVLCLAMTLLLAFTGCGSNTSSSGGSSAGWEPDGTVTMIAAAAAGSGYDTSARQFCKLFNETGIVKATMKVVNDAGGGGQIGFTNFLNNYKGADNMLIVCSTASLNGSIIDNWPATYETLTPIAKLVVDSWTIVSKAGDTRYDTVEKVLEKLKTDPAGIKVGGALQTDPDYVGYVILCNDLGIDISKVGYVVYDGGGESVPALLGGDVDVCISTCGEFSSFVEADQVTALAVATEEPLSGVYEGVPTFKEKNIDFVFGNWRGFWGPADMPEECLKYWQDASKKLIETEAFEKACADMQWIKEPVIDGYAEWVAEFYNDNKSALQQAGVID